MRFKIRTKLLFAFLAMLIPVVALTGLAFYNQKLLHRELTKIKAAASESGHFSDLHFKIHTALMPPHDYLLTGDKKTRDIFKRDMGEVERLFNTIYEGGFCSQCHALPKKQMDENLRGMREGIEKIRLKGEEIFKIEHPVGSRKGSGLMADMDAIVAGLITKQMSSYKEIHGKMLSKALEESGWILNRYVVIMVFGHIVLIGLSFLLAYLSSGYIAGPLEKLYKGAESVATGNFDYKLDIRTGDEIEHLAKEFNFMEEKLRGFYNELEDRVRERTEALQKEKENAQRYLDIAAVMFVAVNADQQVTLINKKGCEVLGCDPEDIIGKNWFDNFIPERLRGEIKDVFNLLMEGRLQRNIEYYENPVLTRDGEERFIAWHNSVLTDEKGRITGTLSAGEDITGRKKAEEELRQRLDELERYQKVTVEREFRIRELRDEVNNLKTKIKEIEGGRQ